MWALPTCRGCSVKTLSQWAASGLSPAPLTNKRPGAFLMSLAEPLSRRVHQFADSQKCRLLLVHVIFAREIYGAMPQRDAGRVDSCLLADLAAKFLPQRMQSIACCHSLTAQPRD